MTRITTTVLTLLLTVGVACAASTNVEINAISPEGVGKSLGAVSVNDSDGGITLTVNVSGIADGEHGFHVHEKGDCAPGKKDGKTEAGLAAGSHYDPHDTKSHRGPDGGGHEGDLPKLTAAGGKIEQTVMVKGVKLADIAGRSLMIHEGGDNYSDNPENGGGKGRIACGVIPKS
jgi:Cu-Zn family superoxide dismutase